MIKKGKIIFGEKYKNSSSSEMRQEENKINKKYDIDLDQMAIYEDILGMVASNSDRDKIFQSYNGLNIDIILKLVVIKLLNK